MSGIIEHPLMSDDKQEKILFSSRSKNYSFLSNFYFSEMTIDGKVYHHVEGYYQSRKFIDINNNAVEHIRNVASPMACKKIAYSYTMPNDKKESWDNNIKDIIMKQAVYTKFITNSDLTKKLLDTGNAILVENNLSDNYWAGGKDGKGQNKLGKMLMELRGILQNIFTEC